MLPKFIKLDSYAVSTGTSLEELITTIEQEYPQYEIVGTLALRSIKNYKYATGFLRRKDLSPGDKTLQEINGRI